jgi:hypothetical protein
MSRRLLLLSAGLLTLACADRPDHVLDPAGPVDGSASRYGARGPSVLTRNMYLGADLNPLLQAQTQQQALEQATAVWARIQASNPPARAGGMADEIAATLPHLVGLQEAVLYHIQSPGDAAFGGQVAATVVAYDFVQLLLDSLTARGLSYVVAAEEVGTVVELPIFTGAIPNPFDDVRFTDREVILARADVPVTNPQGGIFAAGLELTIGGAGGATLDQRRAWTSIDATVYDHLFRFISTHLEIQPAAPIQLAQAAELLAIAGASTLPVVLVGDFNSAADGTQTATYANIVAAGFEDVWHHLGEPGYTCCQAEDLLNVSSELDQRLDIIFLRGFRTTERGSIGARVQLVGHRSKDRLPSGLWPSDHAGVAATLRLTPPAVALQ